MEWWEYPVTQGFGPTDEPLDGAYGGYANFNKGIDYGVPPGTPIKIKVGGKVIAAGSGTDGWGIRVQIQAPDGTIHNYGHLSGVNVKVGDTVGAGSVVGASGNTGLSTGPHLSYDVWKPDGTFINPTPYVSGGAGGDVRTTSTANRVGPDPNAMGPDGRTYGQITGTVYKSDAERAFYLGQQGKVSGSPPAGGSNVNYRDQVAAAIYGVGRTYASLSDDEKTDVEYYILKHPGPTDDRLPGPKGALTEQQLIDSGATKKAAGVYVSNGVEYRIQSDGTYAVSETASAAAEKSKGIKVGKDGLAYVVDDQGNIVRRAPEFDEPAKAEAKPPSKFQQAMAGLSGAGGAAAPTAADAPQMQAPAPATAAVPAGGGFGATGPGWTGSPADLSGNQYVDQINSLLATGAPYESSIAAGAQGVGMDPGQILGAAGVKLSGNPLEDYAAAMGIMAQRAMLTQPGAIGEGQSPTQIQTLMDTASAGGTGLGYSFSNPNLQQQKATIGRSGGAKPITVSIDEYLKLFAPYEEPTLPGLATGGTVSTDEIGRPLTPQENVLQASGFSPLQPTPNENINDYLGRTASMPGSTEPPAPALNAYGKSPSMGAGLTGARFDTRWGSFQQVRDRTGDLRYMNEKGQLLPWNFNPYFQTENYAAMARAPQGLANMLRVPIQHLPKEFVNGAYDNPWLGFSEDAMAGWASGGDGGGGAGGAGVAGPGPARLGFDAYREKGISSTQGMAQGGQVMVDEPIVGMGMNSGQPQFTLGEPNALTGGQPTREVMNVTPLEPSVPLPMDGGMGAPGMGAGMGAQPSMTPTAFAQLMELLLPNLQMKKGKRPPPLKPVGASY